MVEFDLSGIIGWSINIDSATLEVYEQTVGDIGLGYGIYRITSSWDEATVIWNTRPTWGVSAYDYITSDASPGWWTFDVTALVQEWVNETYTNYGLCVTAAGGSCSPSLVNSSEYSDQDLIPTLTIEYTLTDVEGVSWGEIKADSL